MLKLHPPPQYNELKVNKKLGMAPVTGLCLTDKFLLKIVLIFFLVLLHVIRVCVKVKFTETCSQEIKTPDQNDNYFLTIKMHLTYCNDSAN